MRGLDTSLPLPSASSADSSRFRKRLAAALNSEIAKEEGVKPPTPTAGRLKNVVFVVSSWPELSVVVADTALYVPPKATRLVLPTAYPGSPPRMPRRSLPPSRTPRDLPKLSDA